MTILSHVYKRGITYQNFIITIMPSYLLFNGICTLQFLGMVDTFRKIRIRV